MRKRKHVRRVILNVKRDLKVRSFRVTHLIPGDRFKSATDISGHAPLVRTAPGRSCGVNVSAKRWANLRSDLSAAIAASGLHPILTTGKLELHRTWSSLFSPISDLRIRNGLCRFARWASLRRISPAEVDAAIVERFINEMKGSTLVRNLGHLKGRVIRSWNALAQASGGADISPIKVSRPAPIRVPWESLPGAFQQDVASYLTWASVPDPLDEHARARALSPGTLRLRRDQIHSAAAAAIAAGTKMSDLTSLASLVETGLDAARAR
jgi:hypothetical protein